MEAKQTPLIELLERIPQDARLVVEHDQFSSSVHPVGRLCHEAAAALRAALAEPVQEPVAWKDKTYESLHHQDFGNSIPLYTAPPQRKPLTEEELLKAVGWDIAEMYMKLTPNFPVAEAKKETLKNARAIERAHGIGGGNE